jgi:hypothetical protein
MQRSVVSAIACAIAFTLGNFFSPDTPDSCATLSKSCGVEILQKSPPRSKSALIQTIRKSALKNRNGFGKIS